MLNGFCKIIMILSIISIIIGVVCALIGVSRIPTTLIYDEAHPYVNDSTILNQYYLDEQAHSQGYLLIIVGCSSLGVGLICCLASYISIYYLCKTIHKRDVTIQPTLALTSAN